MKLLNILLVSILGCSSVYAATPTTQAPIGMPMPYPEVAWQSTTYFLPFVLAQISHENQHKLRLRVNEALGPTNNNNNSIFLFSIDMLGNGISSGMLPKNTKINDIVIKMLDPKKYPYINSTIGPLIYARTHNKSTRNDYAHKLFYNLTKNEFHKLFSVAVTHAGNKQQAASIDYLTYSLSHNLLPKNVDIPRLVTKMADVKKYPRFNTTMSQLLYARITTKLSPENFTKLFDAITAHATVNSYALKKIGHLAYLINTGKLTDKDKGNINKLSTYLAGLAEKQNGSAGIIEVQSDRLENPNDDMSSPGQTISILPSSNEGSGAEDSDAINAGQATKSQSHSNPVYNITAQR